MKNTLIRKFAYSVAEHGLERTSSSFILHKLTKSELKLFLSFYKKALAKKRVIITASTALTPDALNSLASLYSGKEIITSIDESLGAGVKIQQDDTIIDFTFKKYINDTIDSLKQL